MKKKTLLATLLVAAMVAAQPMGVLARSSSSTSSSSSSSSTQSASKGETSGLASTTSDGQSLSSNGAGSKTENVNAVFAVGSAATAGLPQNVVDSINSINSGSDLVAAIGNQSLAGYAALTQAAAVVIQDQNGVTADQAATVSLYIPNLIEGLQGIKILYYENATGLWVTVDPTAIDFNNHTVTFSMFGSGTVTVLHSAN